MDKIFVFGSFTEDEIVAFQSPQNPPEPPTTPIDEFSDAVGKLKVTTVKPEANGDCNHNPMVPNVTIPGSPSTKDTTQRSPSKVPPMVTAPNDNGTIRVTAVTGKSFSPRGLVNCGNSCYLNSTLQAMLACSPFWDLLQSLRVHTIPQSFPVLHAFASFAGEFEEMELQPSPKKRVEVRKPLTPSMFDPVLQRFNPNQRPRNRQEDAQEFLSFLMNHMHEELLKLEGNDSNNVEASPDEEEWETVGPKNRTSIMRTYNVRESPLHNIFGGQQQSVVKARGSKPSATVEPFYLLHLEITSDAVYTVEDALKYYAAPESLQGYKSARGKTEDASRLVKIKSLPKVLVLHLKRFSYGPKGTDKLHKRITFHSHLTVGRELLASASGTSIESRTYELVATITHHGRDTSSGHYTADAKQSDGKWLRFDDSVVKAVNLRSVFEHDQAYILFYKKLHA